MSCPTQLPADKDIIEAQVKDCQDYVDEVLDGYMERLQGYTQEYREGFKKGFREGFKRGFERGQRRVRRQAAVGLLQAGESIELIQRVTDYPPEEIDRLKRDLLNSEH